ncbi:two-component system, chemotaxis family, response regulator CheB [Halopseudomonas xinjiangensis]|uniref:protein-glutamate methylesterase n=1 Tax=Halopseudomonas xinjiangensis TaxID=487184 RepID=A0A1H1XNI7_9GAMM|nr:chemotaxis protein CheB [Halopseudomonas xinjiangensis]SDT10732.1 two-component system, chemotaxis family, response regulator CheB [Halopseudomonas xinjiangensis]
MNAGLTVVIGASAGGIPSLLDLVASLPPDLDASLFVVQHVSPNYRSALPELLNKNGPFRAVHPTDGDRIALRTIYVAPPDHHMLIDGDQVLVKRGPKENRFRPSIDALFRSAGYSHGQRVIGIVLSGALDDGTSGLWSVKRLGGVTVVQTPAEAEFDGMPLSALEQVDIDHCVPARAIGKLLKTLAEQHSTASVDMPEDDPDRRRAGLETRIAEDADAFQKGIMEAGKLTPFTCPSCHGVLVQIDEGSISRYRCHTGHAYSRTALLSEIVQKVEETYWIAMRSLEEAAMLLDHTADSLGRIGKPEQAEWFRSEAKAAESESRELRDNLLRRRQFSGSNLFGREGG